MEQVTGYAKERQKKSEKRNAKGMLDGNLHFRDVKAYFPGMLCLLGISLAQFFALPSYFALAYLMAHLSESGRCPKGAIAGMALSLLLQWIWGIEAEWIQGIVFLFLVLLIRRPLKKQQSLYLVLSMAVLICIFLSGGGEDEFLLIRRLAGGALCLGCMPAIRRWTTLTKEMNEDDLLCLSTVAVILLCGAARISVFGVNLGVSVGFFVICTAAWLCGAQAGAVAGIGSGLAILCAGQHGLYMMVMPLMGLMAGCFKRKNKLLCSGGYLFCGVCIAYLVMKNIPALFLWNVVIGSALFCLLPKRNEEALLAFVNRMQWMKPRENAYLRMRMQRWVGAIGRLTDALPDVRPMEVDIPNDSEAVAERLCDRCEQLPICWRDDYEKTKKGMEKIVAGTEMDLNRINQYFSHCCRISRIPDILTDVLEKRKQELQRVWMAEYEKKMLEGHLLALSQAAQLISMEGMQFHEEEREWMQRAEEALRKMHFCGTVAYVKCIDGHMQVCVQCDTVALHPVMGEKLAKQLGVYLGVHLQVTEQNATKVMMEEAAVFQAVCGQASACAMGGEEGVALQNGDAVLIRTLPGCRLLAAVSDGMGHGKNAQAESRKTLQMLHGCMEAGYTTKQAMRAVNGAMLNATGGEIFATVDMCLVDLWTGEMQLNKLGAVGSVLIQGQRIRWLCGAALPLGIMEHVMPAEERITLGEGDRLLLFTDGIVDLYAGEEEIMTLLQRHLEESPQEMAERVLEDAINRSGGAPQDDMTVLCLQLLPAFPENKLRKALMERK